MKKYIVLLVATSFLAIGCKDKYAEGFSDGKTKGYADGKVDGYNQGFDSGYDTGFNQTYQNGYNDGQSAGYATGYSEGEGYYTSHDNFADGFNDGYDAGFANGKVDGDADGYSDGYTQYYGVGETQGYNAGLNDGYTDGYTDGFYDGDYDGYHDGYDAGVQVSYANGYNDGYSDGEYSGYNHGYNDGWDDRVSDNYDAGYNDGADAGFNDGYNDGFDDGYWASIGLSNASKSSNPQVKLAAMVNSDLINYSALKKFDETAARGMGFSREGVATVDMEKLATLKEQFYLNQMSAQIKANFGLSSERSMEIAKVAHQFNKLSGTRELTDKDADAFTNSVVGHNLKDIESAVRKSAEGESDLLNNILNDIASKNETSPENVNRIISTIFF